MSIILVFKILWYIFIFLVGCAVFSLANGIHALRQELKERQTENLLHDASAPNVRTTINKKQKEVNLK